MSYKTRKLKEDYNKLMQPYGEKLKEKYDFAASHPLISQSKSQKKIIKELPIAWESAEAATQSDTENDFIKEFLKLEKQYEILKHGKPLFSYSASISIIIIITYLLRKNYTTITLLEPCFDNLPDLLDDFGIKFIPLSEELLHSTEKIYENLNKHMAGEVLFLVDLNNPTGFHLPPESLREIARFCHDHKKLLVIDFTFIGFVLPHKKLVFDDYKILDEEKASYACIEDFAKIFPVLDTKVSFLISSNDIYPAIKRLQFDYLLNVSPFVLNVVRQYMKNAEKDHFASFTKVLEDNRSSLEKALKGTCLEIVPSRQ